MTAAGSVGSKVPNAFEAFPARFSRLDDLVAATARRSPEALAVKAPQGRLTYGELDERANQMARALTDLGVGYGDRVGIWADKSVDTVAAMQAALRLGAAYVPLDPSAPVARTRAVMSDCEMAALVTTETRAAQVLTDDVAGMARLLLDEARPGEGPHEVVDYSPRPVDRVDVDPDDMAYILYTSGSTGTPKGVCISHRNALAVIEWAAQELAVTSADRLSNHAPFHFDLSVLDLYMAFLSGATVTLIPDGMSYVPSRLVEFLLAEEITVWYSVPSALILMMEQGGLVDLPSVPVRAFVFAGEPFPITHLRRLVERWPKARFLNFYGPTETNVCTFHEVAEIDDGRTHPVPIGRACSGDRVWAVRDDGGVAGPGEVGELMVEGPTVLLGYWGHPRHGDGPYATGDLVRLEEDGTYHYLGRRDHMVKVRGHRIELGDIEAALHAFPGVKEAAVVVSGSGVEARLVAYCATDAAPKPTLLEIKRHCAERLPRYMIVDRVHFVPRLPRTRNGKVDRLTLAGKVEDERSGPTGLGTAQRRANGTGEPK